MEASARPITPLPSSASFRWPRRWAWKAPRLAYLPLERDVLTQRQYNILVNAVAPFAASPMTATVKPQHELDQMDPSLVAPIVFYLCHEK
jgi:hypothetical protein